MTPALAATPPLPDLRSLVLVLLASSLAALPSRFHQRVVLPTVVVEIVLGIVFGPQVLRRRHRSSETGRSALDPAKP
jgi:Kef-type K+ transport system membrane component KefB